MFYVTSLNGSQVEPLTNIGTDFNMEQSIDGTLTVSFSCFPENNPAYELLEVESTVNVEGYEFKIKQIQKNDFMKTVTGLSTFFELSKKYIDDIYGGTMTLERRLDSIISGDWTVLIDNPIIDKEVFIPNFGESNVIDLVNTICAAYECEYVILPNRQIHFATKIGGDRDFQYRYKHNIGDVVLTEDTTNLTTVIKGYGAENLEVTYRSPNVSIFGELEGEPITDGDYTTVEDLANYLSTQINDVPELVIESKVVDLTLREIGERVWLIYEPLGIELETRILSQTKVLRNGKLVSDSVIFGNTQPMSSMDLFVKQKAEIDTTRKDFRSRIEQTNDRITFEVNQLGVSIATVDIKADNIALSVIDAKNEMQSAINQTASAIRTEIGGRITTLDGQITTINSNISTLTQTATSLQSTVVGHTTTIGTLGTRMTTAESSISQQATQIQSKVSQVDYNGNTITSLINQNAYGVKIDAAKIDLNGTVSVLDNNIYLKGTTANRGLYFDQYGATGRITSTDYTMSLMAENINMSSMVGQMNFTASVLSFNGYNDLIGVVGSEVNNLYLALNANKTRLYLRNGKGSGNDIGYIPITIT